MRLGLIVLIIVCAASTTNAGLMLGIDGAYSPTDIMPPNVLQILGEVPVPSNAALYIAAYDGVRITGGNLVYGGNLSSYMLLEEYATSIGYPDGPALLADFEAFGLSGITDLAAVTLADGSATPAPLTGVLVDGITLSGSWWGRLDLLDESLNAIQSNNIIPEPMTIVLLGLGGLFLRRRK